MKAVLVALAAAALAWLPHAHGTLHHLEINSDERSLFKIETFCFRQGGNMNVTVKDFSVHHAKQGQVRAGFIVVKTKSESQMQQMLEQSVEDDTCILDASLFKSENILLDLSDNAVTPEIAQNRWKHSNKHHVVQGGDEGLYSLIFARCEPSSSQTSVSFKVNAAFWNPGPNYLSACEDALPSLFFAFFVCFLVALGVWSVLLFKSSANKVHHIHRMMTVLLAVKTLTLLFESIRYHYIAATGSAEGWSIVYYIFAFLKGLLLFTVILLIGTGWSLVKPYLNDREKKIVLFVLVLQVLDNVAMVVIEEMAPGSQEWYTWRDVLHLVDIICCCAILFPIVWSIRHLRQAASADGKAEHNIMKLTLFRQFYIMVVTYIYFTRIIVYLLAATMPYDWMWLRFLFTELATLCFYVVTGYKFKPAEDNPYLPVSKDDPDQLDEFGLDDSELELTEQRQQAASRVDV